jgi:hypothetical protein
MNIKARALAALRQASNLWARSWERSWRYWGKPPMEVMRLHRAKLEKARATRRRRKRNRWYRGGKRYPFNSQRRA